MFYIQYCSYIPSSCGIFVHKLVYTSIETKMVFYKSDKISGIFEIQFCLFAFEQWAVIGDLQTGILFQLGHHSPRLLVFQLALVGGFWLDCRRL